MNVVPLGCWKGVLQQEDLPVKYISISDYLDMAQQTASFCQTRIVNGDKVQTKGEKCSGTVQGWQTHAFKSATFLSELLLCIKNLLQIIFHQSKRN